MFVLSGTLAAKYEKLGGEVKWMGKPDKVISNFLILIVLDFLFGFILFEGILNIYAH